MSIIDGNDVEFKECGVCPLEKDLIKMSLILEVHFILVSHNCVY